MPSKKPGIINDSSRPQAQSGSASGNGEARGPGTPTMTRYRSELIQEMPEDVKQLAARIRRESDAEVRFDHGSRAAYSTDASNYRQIPIGVIVPRSSDDVVATFAACRDFDVPITSRGGGTSLAGQCCNVAVVIDYSKYMDQVLEIDVPNQRARVQPGCKLDTLRDQAAEHGLTFGPDPSTHDRNTLGGMIGNNSCGIHSVMSEFYGPGPLTEHNVETLDLLLYDGTRLTVGPTSEEELHSIIAEGGRRGDIYRALRDLRDEYQNLIRERYPQIPRRVSGFNLNALLPEHGFDVARALTGTEGTCVGVLEATVKLIPSRPKRTLVVLGYPTIYEAADHIDAIMAHHPIGLEGIDEQLIEDMKLKGLHPGDVTLVPEGRGWLLVEFGDDSREKSEQAAQALMDEIEQLDEPPTVKLFQDRWEEQKLWHVRESGLGATSLVPTWEHTRPGWEDAAVDPKHLGRYLRQFRDLLTEFHYDCSLYGHFGQGCIHCRITFDLDTEPGVQHWLRFLDRAAELVVRNGGSLSGEHGDGQARAALLPKMYGADLIEAFRKFKTIWDPDRRMNPGKVVDAYTPDQNLRTGPAHYHPGPASTYFQFPDDGGSFARAANRCIGVGKCRQDAGGVMCPSYMATREEEHSTRGRSRILFEMFEGDVLPQGLHDKHVHDALDLCLACKGCKSECPVNVDMATYKAEFLAHYFKRHFRPRPAHAMGRIYWWSRIASKMPRLVNFFARTFPFEAIAKWLGGVAQQRTMPTFATPSFREWFHSGPETDPLPRIETLSQVTASDGQSGGREKLRHADVLRFRVETYPHTSRRHHLSPAGSRQRYVTDRVLLWPDTFNNYLNTDAAIATTRVLRAYGYEVEIPPRPLCCGRPLYDFGMLRQARRLLRQILRVLEPWITAGIPVVGIEPSCVAVFRDELVEMLPHREDAQRLARQTFLLSEFLDLQNHPVPSLERKALVHGHCHHKSIMHMDAEVSILRQLGLDYEIVEATCCGMAGSFGFAAKHYDVSVAVGEQGLLPVVREAEPETLIIANGFSCQQQIEQLTDRHALHLAQVVEMAFQENQPQTPSAEAMSQ